MHGALVFLFFTSVVVYVPGPVGSFVSMASFLNDDGIEMAAYLLDFAGAQISSRPRGTFGCLAIMGLLEHALAALNTPNLGMESS